MTAHRRAGDPPGQHHDHERRLAACENGISQILDRLDRQSGEHERVIAKLDDVRNEIAGLRDDTAGLREFEHDTKAAMRIADRISAFVSRVWKPILLVFLVGYLVALQLKTGEFPK